MTEERREPVWRGCIALIIIVVSAILAICGLWPAGLLLFTFGLLAIRLTMSKEKDRNKGFVLNTPPSVPPTFSERTSTSLSSRCYNMAQDFIRFQNALENSHSIIESIHAIRGMELVDSSPIVNGCLDNRLSFLIISDMLRCFEQMGHRIGENKMSQLTIAVYLFKIINGQNAKEKDVMHFLDANWNKCFQSMSAIADVARNAVSGEYNLFLPPVIAETDSILASNYKRLILDYAILVAETDGYKSKKESEWISGFMETISETLPSSNEEKINHVKNHGLKELDSLIGLSSVKEEIKELQNLIIINKRRKRQGLKSPTVSYHCVFKGNPGTAKTTVARILADIYKECGILKKGHLIETDRSGLVAEYVGQTAVKTNKLIDSALDGVLFIDEAYSLSHGDKNDFGHEAIATLLKRMEDDRQRLVVILAGYDKEIDEFINSNPGLQSRFNRYISFPDYSKGELLEIFRKIAAENDYILSDSALTKVSQKIRAILANKTTNFGNAREMRNIFESAIQKQATRLAKIEHATVKQMKTLVDSDIL